MVKLSVRVHIGGLNQELMQPCDNDCLAYNLMGLHETGAGRHVFKVNAPLALQHGDPVTIAETPRGGWDIAQTTVDEVLSDNSFTVANELPFGLGSCDRSEDFAGGCGYVAMTGYLPNFTIAGDRDGNPAEDLPYFTMHADFWNTWNQAALDALEEHCVNNAPGDTTCASPNIDDNAQVRAMMDS